MLVSVVSLRSVVFINASSLGGFFLFFFSCDLDFHYTGSLALRYAHCSNPRQIMSCSVKNGSVRDCLQKVYSRWQSVYTARYWYLKSVSKMAQERNQQMPEYFKMMFQL